MAQGNCLTAGIYGCLNAWNLTANLPSPLATEAVDKKNGDPPQPSVGAAAREVAVPEGRSNTAEVQAADQTPRHGGKPPPQPIVVDGPEGQRQHCAWQCERLPNLYCAIHPALFSRRKQAAGLRDERGSGKAGAPGRGLGRGRRLMPTDKALGRRRKLAAPAMADADDLGVDMAAAALGNRVVTHTDDRDGCSCACELGCASAARFGTFCTDFCAMSQGQFVTGPAQMSAGYIGCATGCMLALVPKEAVPGIDTLADTPDMPDIIKEDMPHVVR